MTPAQLKNVLAQLVEEELRLSVMIWGPPGVGKSSIVAQIAAASQLELVDLRLSQLAPTDLRGLPVPEDGISRWYPPEFLPQGGRGILFLDELNMAPPTLQGIAQQLILDRRVGSYRLPPAWFVWSAGNRKEDRAAVFHMPSPLANRFIHFEVGPHLESFRSYAIREQLHEQVLAFLAYRPELLHKLDPHHPAWPSPRAWEMASQLHALGISVEPALGLGVAEEFRAFVRLYEERIDLEKILEGRGQKISFSPQPSMRYAITVALGLRAQSPEQALNALHWLQKKAGAEWLTLAFSHLIPQTQRRGEMGSLAGALMREKKLSEALKYSLSVING